MKPVEAVVREGGAERVNVEGSRGGKRFQKEDWIAAEVPIALEFNGISHAVMLATPLDLADFALGFSLSEGILDEPSQLYGVDEEVSEEGITVQLEVASAAFARLKDRRRSMTGRTGCGLCGTESLSHVCRLLPKLPQGVRVAKAAVARAMTEMRSLQVLNQVTGAIHAAAWCDTSGEVKLLREDVGRHNALDKLVGALVKTDIEAGTGFIAVTSRASFEMVQKTAIAGVPLLAAVSAPTSFAVKTAQEAGLTLLGFVRDEDSVVYAHPERFEF
jgi:FdhD protein